MSLAETTDSYRARVKRQSFTKIPIIDLAPVLNDEPGGLERVAEEVRDACMQIGFFYIKNHNVSKSALDAFLKASKDFFGLPLDEKMQVHIAKSPNHRGYMPLYEESFYDTLDQKTANKDHKEGYEIGIELPLDHPDVVAGIPMLGPNFWPKDPAFGESALRYAAEMATLREKMFELFAVALYQKKDYFKEVTTRPPSILRVLHYIENQFPQDDTNWGISAHTDYEAFTILYANSPGLQVLNANDEWVDAPPIEGTFIINIGDVIELLSNGAMQATSHRVLNMGSERYSVPQFCTLDYETVVSPLADWVTATYPAAYKPLRSGAHLYSSTIRAFSYLREKWLAGRLAMPDDASDDTFFGRSKKALGVSA